MSGVNMRLLSGGNVVKYCNLLDTVLPKWQLASVLRFADVIFNVNPSSNFFPF